MASFCESDNKPYGSSLPEQLPTFQGRLCTMELIFSLWRGTMAMNTILSVEKVEGSDLTAELK
jgi:hypothetical protein